jgi:glycosyltransferase involved in cell wall biosynthesis
VGNLQEGKGIDLTLTALARLQDAGINGWHYRVVGDGVERAQLEAMSNSLDLGDHVTFAGAIAHHEVPEALIKSDVFVMPSYREAFGIAYLEAMSMARIAIGVQGQGPSQFIRNGETGFLVPPKDIKALADLLRAIVTGDRARWRTIAAAGALEARSNWSWDAHARSLERVFSEIVHPMSQ